MPYTLTGPGFDGEANGFIASTDSSLGLPASNISISGGGQIQTITEWTNDGYEVPVYAYVVAGVPRAQLTAEAGISEDEPDGCWAKFISLGGSGGNTGEPTGDGNASVVTVQITGVVPDPTAAKSTGGGSQFTWFVESTIGAEDPFSTAT